MPTLLRAFILNSVLARGGPSSSRGRVHRKKAPEGFGRENVTVFSKGRVHARTLAGACCSLRKIEPASRSAQFGSAEARSRSKEHSGVICGIRAEHCWLGYLPRPHGAPSSLPLAPKHNFSRVFFFRLCSYYLLLKTFLMACFTGFRD